MKQKVVFSNKESTKKISNVKAKKIEFDFDELDMNDNCETSNLPP